MKLISLLLLLCLVSNSFANTGAIQELEKHLDEYNYALTVEWDQKDKSFSEKQTQAFMEQLTLLYKEKGLASEDVILMLEKRMKNKALLDALKLKVNLMGKNITPIEIMESIKKDSVYSSGASWNGEVINWAIGGVVIAIIAVIIAHDEWWSDNHTCTKYDEAEQCVDEYDCTGEFCSYDGTYCDIITRCTKYERN